MSETRTDEKTEKASPHKLRKAKQAGQVIRSRDVATAVSIFACLKLLTWLAPVWISDFQALFALSLAHLSSPGETDNAWSILFPATGQLLLKMLAPFFLIPLAAILLTLFPGGWIFSGKHWIPDLKRLHPIHNLKKIISPRHSIQTGISFLKALSLGGVLWYSLFSQLSEFIALQRFPISLALTRSTSLFMDLILDLCMVFIVFAIIDLPLQAFIFLREQRMTKQEVKDEYKTTEGRPEVKSRIRQLQRQLAKRSIRKKVPEADVVLTNPSHYAVALKYDETRAEAPFVVAKGIDETAFFIQEVAKEHEIDIISIPPLARAIYNTSQINQQIPSNLYRAVAQVLTYVLQLKAFRSSQRKQQPIMPLPDLPLDSLNSTII